MIGLDEELRRLTPGFREEEAPPTVGLVIQVDVRCPGDAPTVLDRVRVLLAIAVRHRLQHLPDEEVESEAEPFAVDEAFWAAALPRWFLDRTPFESAGRRTGGWTVEGWLYWFLSAHENRAWRWVSASVASPERVVVDIQVTDIPLPWDALRWALLAAGATSAEL